MSWLTTRVLGVSVNSKMPLSSKSASMSQPNSPKTSLKNSGQAEMSAVLHVWQRITR